MAEQFKLNRPLLGTNFFAGDVIAGLGPYIAIYLLSAYHWKPGGIGMALAAGSIATVIAQVPAGAFIDATYWKRSVLAVCAILVGVSATLIVVTNNPPWIVYSAQIAIGVACAFLGPGIAAVTLGWWAQSILRRRPAPIRPGTMPGTCLARPWAHCSRSIGRRRVCSC